MRNGWPKIMTTSVNNETFTNEVLEKGKEVLKHKSLKALVLSRENQNNDEFINYINLRNINVIIDWNTYIKTNLGNLQEMPEWKYCKGSINNKHGFVQSICLRKDTEKI